ncbi:MAG TPA: hypothetical protein VFF39_06160 [Verrucomicrobiae bacterium]|nr:hypothetical protein [Verrucomicrobiae bacterium]
MLNRFAIFLLISALLSAVVVAQDSQPQTPPATQNPSPAQVPPTPQQQPPSAEPVADPPKDASPKKTEPGSWRKIKIVPARKPKQVPPGTLDKGTAA